MEPANGVHNDRGSKGKAEGEWYIHRPMLSTESLSKSLQVQGRVRGDAEEKEWILRGMSKWVGTTRATIIWEPWRAEAHWRMLNCFGSEPLGHTEGVRTVAHYGFGSFRECQRTENGATMPDLIIPWCRSLWCVSHVTAKRGHNDESERRRAQLTEGMRVAHAVALGARLRRHDLAIGRVSFGAAADAWLLRLADCGGSFDAATFVAREALARLGFPTFAAALHEPIWAAHVEIRGLNATGSTASLCQSGYTGIPFSRGHRDTTLRSRATCGNPSRWTFLRRQMK